ncbi:MAG: DNA adenine methylase [Halocynthiibacter sp.]
MTEIAIKDISEYPRRGVQNAVSPFRYPGGKGFFSGYLGNILDENNFSKKIAFAEPFCGGAGAALNLLEEGRVSELLLNDADIRIYSAWRAMLEETDRFMSCIHSVPLTLEYWHQCREIASTERQTAYSFELGFATFYLNRTTHSGIVDRSGPIGGYQQKGKWKIDARFNRERLSKKVDWIGSQSDCISLTNMDGLDFIARTNNSRPEGSFYFVDPPYVQAGDKLYKNSMNEAKHYALSDILNSLPQNCWVLTYDDAPLIQELYREQKMFHLVVNYSLRKKRKENELLIVSA